MIRLGVIGLSSGNGHPYSWSAIFNGYNANEYCEFPIITKYLAKQKFPEDFLSKFGRVTHIWTQDFSISEQVAKFSKIDNIVDNPEDMIDKVDAILLARDDADSHYSYAETFIKHGVPIFIDKPLAYTVEEANKIYGINKDCLIYTCSSIRFAKEFQREFSINDFNYVEASVMKSWSKYSIHIIEPIINMFPGRGKLISVKKLNVDVNVKLRVVQWENLNATFKVYGGLQTNLSINLISSKECLQLNFEDTFYAFKESLFFFIQLINGNVENIDKNETLEIVEIIEKGM